VAWIVILCTGSAIFGAVMVRLITGAFPLPQAQAQAMQTGLAGLDQSVAAGPIPGALDFFKGVVPGNVISAAANGDVLPLVVFALLFALAVSRLEAKRRRTLVDLFEAVADALLIIIGWVLWIAPLGVFALAFSVGASAGGAAFAGLGHYILVISTIGVLVTFWAYPIVLIWARIGLGAFSKAMIAPQSVAISTRSSLASLPAVLGVREQVADVTLPLAVALFRATGPAMNTAVAFYVAHWLGYEPTMTQMIAATAVGAVMSYGAVSLPGEVSFISSIAPIAMALGVPIAPLALLVAVEMVPDIFRTLGNVTLDVAVATVVDRGVQEETGEAKD
jgi:Na+/H+-dicarboxylate symporter